MGKKELAAWQSELMATKKTLPPTKPFSRHTYQRRVQWHAIEIPRRVAEARAQFPIRHLGDLLLILGIPWSTAHDWATEKEARSVPAWNQKAKPGKRYHRPARPARKEWLAACKGISIPKNHELHFLRYITHPALAAFRERFDKMSVVLSGGLGIGEHDREMLGRALHTAADEIIGAAYVRAIERRSARRKAKFGFDPIEMALSWSVETHGAPRRTIVEAITKSEAIDWQELASQKSAARASLSPEERSKELIPPTARRPGSRKAKRIELRRIALQTFDDTVKRLTEQAMLRVLGYILPYKSDIERRLHRPVPAKGRTGSK